MELIPLLGDTFLFKVMIWVLIIIPCRKDSKCLLFNVSRTFPYIFFFNSFHHQINLVSWELLPSIFCSWGRQSHERIWVISLKLHNQITGLNSDFHSVLSDFSLSAPHFSSFIPLTSEGPDICVKYTWQHGQPDEREGIPKSPEWPSDLSGPWAHATWTKEKRKKGLGWFTRTMLHTTEDDRVGDKHPWSLLLSTKWPWTWLLPPPGFFLQPYPFLTRPYFWNTFP